MRRVSKRQKERTVILAETMVNATRLWAGDHGFTGRALVAWHRQREDMIKALKTVIKNGGTISGRTAIKIQVETLRCPVSVARSDGNFDHRGTDGGSYWTDMVRCIIADAVD